MNSLQSIFAGDNFMILANDFHQIGFPSQSPVSNWVFFNHASNSGMKIEIAVDPLIELPYR